jgi:hypothetical protein
VAGLVPAIHVFEASKSGSKDVGAGNKSGHGEYFWL